MSQNLRLVTYFTSTFYFDHTMELAHIVSPEFRFTINSGALMNFEEYIKRRKIFGKNTTLTIDTFTSSDDTNFYANFVVSFSGGKRYLGKIMLIVSNGLIEAVLISYDLNEHEYKEFERLLFK